VATSTACNQQIATQRKQPNTVLQQLSYNIDTVFLHITVVAWFSTRLAELGLGRHVVSPDGNCMFNCMALWNNAHTQQEWRNILCTNLELRVADVHDRRAKQLKNSLLRSAQDYFTTSFQFKGEKYSRPTYTTFEELMVGMRGTEWGYAEFWEEFCTLTNSTLTTFLSDGTVQFCRPRGAERQTNHRNLFCINDLDANGILPLVIVIQCCMNTEITLYPGRGYHFDVAFPIEDPSEALIRWVVARNRIWSGYIPNLHIDLIDMATLEDPSQR
jgi:hypothetical protein